MAAQRKTLVAAALALASGVVIPATAQEITSYTVVEERSTYYEPSYYVAPAPIIVERPYATEDMLINEDVKATLASDPRLDSRSIAVETNRNVVTLSGLVNRPGQARIAQRDASQVNGVAEVRNYLRSKVGDSSSW